MQSLLKITGNQSLMIATTGIVVTYKGFYFWPMARIEDHSTQNELMVEHIAVLKGSGFFAKEDSEMKHWVMLPFLQNKLFTVHMLKVNSPSNNYGLMIWDEDPSNAVRMNFSARDSSFVHKEAVGGGIPYKEGEGGILFKFNSQDEQIRADNLFRIGKLEIFDDFKGLTIFLPIKQYSNVRRINVAVSCG